MFSISIFRSPHVNNINLEPWVGTFLEIAIEIMTPNPITECRVRNPRVGTRRKSKKISIYLYLDMGWDIRKIEYIWPYGSLLFSSDILSPVQHFGGDKSF